MISEEGHTTVTDWWSLGTTPFYNKKKNRMYELIQWGEIRYPKDIKVSNEAYDVINKLLAKNPEKRLGAH